MSNKTTTTTTTRLQTLQRKELKFRKDFGRFIQKQNTQVLQIVQQGTLYHCMAQTQDAKNAFAFGRTPARSFYKMVSRFNLKYAV